MSQNQSLSDTQIMLLEQVTYADKDLFNAMKIPYPSSNADLLDVIKTMSDDDIYALSQQKSIKNHTMTGKEWADIFRALKADPQIMSLECKSYDDKAKGFCYVSPSGEAYVTFKGTSGAYEWKDDALGLGMADTPCQEWALDYIESLPYDNITVAGHSKGGNKAQYVTILSDKVDRCVSMDGQGFSKEFLEKYQVEIERKGALIKNYSYKNDFVHILMNYVPGAQQIYCDGTNTGIECHNPNAMLKIEYDKDTKKWNVTYHETGENPGMTYFHNFTCFVANNMPLEERQKTGEYLGCLISIMLAGGEYKINGVVYNSSNIKDYLLSDPDAASTILAYLMKYIEIDHLSKKEAMALLSMFGIDGMAAEGIWLAIDAQDLDGEHDLGYYLFFFKRMRREAYVTAFDEVFLGGILTDAKRKRNRIKANASSIHGGITTKVNKKRNFTEESFNTIRTAIEEINAQTVEGTSSWTAFAGEEWYGEISAGLALNGIRKYFDRLNAVNRASKTRIANVYQSVQSLDAAFSARVQKQVETMQGFAADVTELADTIG